MHQNVLSIYRLGDFQTRKRLVDISLQVKFDGQCLQYLPVNFVSYLHNRLKRTNEHNRLYYHLFCSLKVFQHITMIILKLVHLEQSKGLIFPSMSYVSFIEFLVQININDI